MGRPRIHPLVKVPKWTEEQKETIAKFLKERQESSRTAIAQIAAMADMETNVWAMRSIKYWRWTDAFISWCLHTLGKTEGKQDAESIPKLRDKGTTPE